MRFSHYFKLLGNENAVCLKTAFVKIIIIVVVTIVTSIVNASCFGIIQRNTGLEKQDFSFLLVFKII